MREERFKTALPLLVLFLFGTAIFSYSEGNPWWLIVSVICVSVIYLLHKVGARE